MPSLVEIGPMVLEKRKQEKFTDRLKGGPDCTYIHSGIPDYRAVRLAMGYNQST